MLNGDPGGEVSHRQRARFEAVRRRVFEEMFDVSSKKRLAFMLPFHTIVMVVMAVHGAPRMTLGVYALAALYFGVYSRHHLVASAPEEEFDSITKAEAELAG